MGRECYKTRDKGVLQEMKIQVVSDNHLEHGMLTQLHEELINCDSDIIVIAGDYSKGTNLKNVLINLHYATKGKPILFVLGNHEFYGSSRKSFEPFIKNITKTYPNIHILCEDIVIIDNVVFLGSTGWWDGSYGQFTEETMMGLNDFRMIYDIMDNENGIAWGNKAREFFENNLMFYTQQDMKVVCISHHMPHTQCVHPMFANDKLNVFFCNNWNDIIGYYEPNLWIHGHTHTSNDFYVGKTRIVCNPQGYPSYSSRRCADGQKEIVWNIENIRYNPQFVVEI